ncbi:FtsX-like permease family protein [Parageobacillus thermoglucosidasius]|uniref:FtsX-like permease family protein n=1 Tax=Parageobacillus thermoglucosidasius TaxID=1426 RepID=UPI00025B7701|nr:FtsX-like permease family protein [Parageobacillus thermoglucosidasius]KYD17774.1 hypothetical protein B4168_2335 [Anoxybacillus flavithermus]REK54435.1 MAG: hypothetical protein C6P36_14625 [Geobacillus sp.]EID43138.1 ABC transporter, permease protein [Parageobacillus thermoglucosidasius TNO-09.020]MBY6268442.1 hypothetical protein [Parageobacillus thermoglucosidasius]OAO87760.1 ABC transporter permease protein [Parageobacillus thermoglucosidasius]
MGWRRFVDDNTLSVNITHVRKKRQQIGIKQAIVVSALFLLAADSILYFKLYNDLEQDSKQYEALSKLGLTLKEMKQIAAKQVAILFFIPFAVATVHAGFAFKMLQNMVSGSVVKTSVLVILLFFVVQLGYYFLIRSLYTKKVEQVM